MDPVVYIQGASLWNAPRNTLPSPCVCVCALTHSRGDVWCNGDCGIGNNVLRQHRHATLSVPSYWKEQKNERVTAAAEHLISQPNSPEEGLFKFGCVQPVSGYTQITDEGWRDGLLALSSSSLLAASDVKRPCHVTRL